MKKIVSLALVGLLVSSSLSSAFAGGWMMPIYNGGNDFQTVLENITDEDLKELITKNILTISSNNVSEDYEYNNAHFYTKKLTANVMIPEDIKAKAKRVFISFSESEPMMMYDAVSSTVPTTTTDAGNHIEINMNLSDANGEISIERKDFDTYIKNDYGTSFMGTVYLEFEGGIKVPFSNSFWLYLQKDNVEGKKSHLMNLYYQQNQYAGYANIYELLQKVFVKLQKKLDSTAKYISVLEATAKKIDEKLTKIDAVQKAMVEWITTEEHFAPKVKDFWVQMEKFNLLNDIKYQIASEIKTKQSQGIIEELFGSDGL